jgi:transketolase
MFPPSDGGNVTSELAPDLRSQIENTIRFLAVDAVEKAGCGHPGAPMGLARAAFELWDRHLRFDPTDPAWPLRDRFVLSAGHASMLLYSLLHLYGFDVSRDELVRFRQADSKTPGHPEHGETPGVEVTTGPLGQGFAHAVGMAVAARMTRARFAAGAAGPGHHFVYAIASDGDLMEGVSYESASLAGHLGLGNLVVLYDDNQITIDGPIAFSFSEDVPKRFEAQKWHVQRCDGEDHAGLARALEAARAETGRPSLIVVRTVIGKGSPNRAGTSKAHGEKLGAEEAKKTKEALGWPLEPTFLIPDAVKTYLAARISAKQAERKAADAELDRWREANPERAAQWDATRGQRVPDGLVAELAKAVPAKADATRKYSGAVIQRLAELAPFLVGGSADLAGSNNTPIEKAAFIGPAAPAGTDPFAGRNFHFGIREHAMAAVANGIDLDGTFRPFVGTFLVFSDYMRPSLRLASLMKRRTLFVFTHDSIFLGEDGPTHQPIEHLDAIRAIPGITLFRPADGIETAAAWAWAMQKARGPVVFVLTRQTVPLFERDPGFAPEAVWQGAYVVREAGERPAVVLLATGSEVPVACAAAAKLEGAGVAARVVSAPSLELFEAQGADFRNELLPPGVPVVAVEAARGGSLLRYTAPDGLLYGIDRFGMSAPLADLENRFGFTGDALAAKVRAHLGRKA